jgi:prevent-host-death family protein
MKVYTFSEARQKFSTVLDYAQKDGVVRVTRRDGRAFIIQPVKIQTSPLAVEGVQLNIPKEELVDFIYEGRRG